MCAAIAAYFLLAFTIDYLGVVTFDAKSALVSVPTVCGVLFLIILNSITGGDVPWSKQGHDFSILAFGAILSTTTLQFFLKEPTLPRLAQGGFGQKMIDLFQNDQRYMTLVILFCLAILTLSICVVTALIETGLRNAKDGALLEYRNAVSLLNYVIGTISLAFYIIIVCGGI